MRTKITRTKTPPNILLRINSSFNSSSLRLRYAKVFGLNFPLAIKVIISFALSIIMGKSGNLLSTSEASLTASLALLIGFLISFYQFSSIGRDIFHIFVSGSSFLATPSTTTIVFCKSNNCI